MRADAAALVRHVERRCWAGIVGANVASALLIIPGGALVWPVYFPDASITLTRTLLLAAAVGVPYLAFGCVTCLHLIVRPKLRTASGWLTAGREPTQRERQLLATQPRRQATTMMAYWVVFPLWAIPYA